MWQDKLQALLSSSWDFWQRTSRREKLGWLLVIVGLSWLVFSSISQVVYATGQTAPIKVDNSAIDVNNSISASDLSSADTGETVSVAPDHDQGKQALMTIDVSGAVVAPGIYQLPASARVSQAITTAGGLSKRANSQYVAKQLNLATKLADGQKLYIPFAGELIDADLSTAQPTSVIEHYQSKSNSLVNLNTASLDELDTLPGIGQKRAQDILAGRPYTSLEQLVERQILTATVMEKLKELVTLGN